MMTLIYILIGLVILYAVFLFVTKSFFRKRWSNQDRTFFAKNWQKILSEKDEKHKILDADKLLDAMLKKKGFTGSLGDKLKNNAKLFTDLNGLWEAHRLRNKLAHEIDFNLKPAQTAQAMKGFKNAFKDLELL